MGSHLLTAAQFCHASLLSISTLSVDNDNVEDLSVRLARPHSHLRGQIVSIIS